MKKPCTNGQKFRTARIILALAVLLGGTGPAWAQSPPASPQSPEVIGGAANGCLANSAALPSDGPGFEAIRISRRRFFGHGDTVAFVERLGAAAKAAGLQTFYVGDMSMRRGGPMPSGHGSHQNGLDVDIWFNLERKPALAPAEREDVPLPSMLRADGREIDPARFGRDQAALLRLAATDPHTDRIFVHWAIKQALCADPRSRSWLHRLRPWWGHDEHFHVRLHCPPDSPDCAGQEPIPPGDGCDASLAWWAEKHERPTAPPGPRPPPPPRCRSLLSER